MLDTRHPVHVTMRVLPRVLSLRTRALYAAIRKTMARYLGLDDFRICHLSIQKTHLHMLVEATDPAALIRRMRSFTINCARAILRAEGISGQVFAHRYHARAITTARQAYANVRYVLNIWREHRVDWEHLDFRRIPFDAGFPVDPYSSGSTFAHWSIPIPPMPAWYVPLLVSPPRTRLLASVRHVDPFAIPSVYSSLGS